MAERGAQTPDTDTDTILCEVSDGVARLTLNRPHRRNALDFATTTLLARRVDDFARRSDVRCVIVRGSGTAFCSGADLQTAGPGLPQREDNIEMMASASRLINAIVRAHVPVIAEVNGAAAGVGASLALSCDLIIASDTAYFLLPFTGIGLIPDGGATATVAASIGRARAMRMALLQERMSAEEAHRGGLIAMVCASEELPELVDQTARTLASGAARALALTKRAINAQTLSGLDGALARETEDQLEMLEGCEFAEGVSAFRERRQPVFAQRQDASVTS